MNFGGQEKAKRDEFYEQEQNQFKEDLKVKKDNENEIQRNEVTKRMYRTLVDQEIITESEMGKLLKGEIPQDELLKLVRKKYEGKNIKRQGNLKQEKISEENRDGTEYRGG